MITLPWLWIYDYIYRSGTFQLFQNIPKYFRYFWIFLNTLEYFVTFWNILEYSIISWSILAKIFPNIPIGKLFSSGTVYMQILKMRCPFCKPKLWDCLNTVWYWWKYNFKSSNEIDFIEFGIFSVWNFMTVRFQIDFMASLTSNY